MMMVSADRVLTHDHLKCKYLIRIFMIFPRNCMRISEASIRIMRVHQHMMRRFSCDKKMPMVDTSLD